MLLGVCKKSCSKLVHRPTFYPFLVYEQRRESRRRGADATSFLLLTADLAAALATALAAALAAALAVNLSTAAVTVIGGGILAIRGRGCALRSLRRQRDRR